MKSIHCLLIILCGYADSCPRVHAEEPATATVIERLAFGSCANQNQAQPIWDVVVAQKPDVFVFVGDNIYADTEDMGVMKAKYALLGEKPGYRKLRQTCPILATWDDHDYGVNDGGADYPKKREAQQIMLDFFEVPADSPRRAREGIYDAVVFGPEGRRVQIITLDTRYFKSAQTRDTREAAEKQRLNLVGWYVPNNDPATTLLGEAQWKWLESQLKVPADLRIVASSIQVVADEKGMESWGNFPHERQRLLDLIATTKAGRVLVISGDVHFSEVSRTTAGAYPLYDFTSSGLTNSSETWANAVNSHRVSSRAYFKPTAGIVEIDWTAADPSLVLRAVGLDNETGFEHRILLSELDFPNLRAQ